MGTARSALGMTLWTAGDGTPPVGMGLPADTLRPERDWLLFWVDWSRFVQQQNSPTLPRRGAPALPDPQGGACP